jgi:hypothetical protein
MFVMRQEYAGHQELMFLYTSELVLLVHDVDLAVWL